MAEYEIKIGLYGSGVLELLQVVESGLEAVCSVKQVPNLALVSFKVDRGIAAGADDICIRLEPTKSLMELVAAARAGKIERGIS